MSIMSFNAFQRLLQNRNIDGQVAFVLTTMYEQISEVSKQLDDGAKVLLEIARSMENIVELQAQTREALHRFVRQGRPDGVEVGSVANDPNDTEH